MAEHYIQNIENPIQELSEPKVSSDRQPSVIGIKIKQKKDITASRLINGKTDINETIFQVLIPKSMATKSDSKQQTIDIILSKNHLAKSHTAVESQAINEVQVNPQQHIQAPAPVPVPATTQTPIGYATHEAHPFKQINYEQPHPAPQEFTSLEHQLQEQQQQQQLHQQQQLFSQLTSQINHFFPSQFGGIPSQYPGAINPHMFLYQGLEQAGLQAQQMAHEQVNTTALINQNWQNNMAELQMGQINQQQQQLYPQLTTENLNIPQYPFQATDANLVASNWLNNLTQFA